MTSKRIRPEDATLTDLYVNQGLGAKEIADAYGVHHVTASKWLRLLGLNARRVPDISRESLAARWNVDHTLAGIAKHFGVGRNTILRRARTHQLGPKPVDRSGPKNPRWRGGWREDYGHNWKQQKYRARERDDYTCQRCGATREDIGGPPDVHHIVPARTFEDYREANRLGNLISLCPRCHRHVQNVGMTAVPRNPDRGLFVSGRQRSPCLAKTPPIIDPNVVAAMYNGGMSWSDISDTLGVSDTTVLRSLRRAGVSCSRKVCLGEADRQAIKNAIARGATRTEMAERFGVNVATIYRVCPVNSEVSARKPRLPQGDRDQVSRLIVAGEDRREVAQQYNISVSTTYKICPVSQVA